MTERAEPMKKTVKASEARQQLPQLLNTVYRGDTRVLVERSGIPVAAIVSARDLEELTRLDQQRAEFDRALARMQEAFKDVPPEEIEQETNRIVAEVRAQLRDERTAAGSDRTAADRTRTTG